MSADIQTRIEARGGLAISALWSEDEEGELRMLTSQLCCCYCCCTAGTSLSYYCALLHSPECWQDSVESDFIFGECRLGENGSSENGPSEYKLN